MSEMFEVTIHRDGVQTFRSTGMTQAEAERFRARQRLHPDEVMTVAPEVSVRSTAVADFERSAATRAMLVAAAEKPEPRRPFVLINITGGVVEGEWSYAGTGRPIVHVVDFDREEADWDEIRSFCEDTLDIAAEWQTYIDALTDEVEQAADQRDILSMREEIEALLDNANGEVLIAGVVYDAESGEEAEPLEDE